MKKLFNSKALLIILMTFVCILLSSTSIFACTAVYVGEDVSDDGTIIVGRSNDYPDVWPNYVSLVDHVDNEPGRTMPVDNGQTVFAEIPAETYKYTATPWMDSATTYNGLESDAASTANEYGVTMTMSISAFTNDKALSADPEPENGLTEFTADDLVICQSKTARQAVEVLTSLVDKYGSSESNIAIIADQNEAWCVEMYTGHQYAAVKLPSDKVAVFGNEFNIEYLSEYEEYIISDELISLAEDNGFAVYGTNDELNLVKTYSIDNINYSHMRTWIGHQLLSPSMYGDDYDQNAIYPLVFTPDNKVSVQDVMEILRNRFESTQYSPDETGRIDMRVIGTDTALSVHVLQIFPELPSDMSVITWESAAPALYGVFVPFSIFETDIESAYGLNQAADQQLTFDYDDYPWYALEGLNTLCLNDYEVYGNPVRAYWHEAETNMIKGIKEVLTTAVEKRETSFETASKYVTDYCTGLQDKAFEDAKSLMSLVLWYQSKYCNTMKVGKNPETHEATDEVVKHDPIEINLDGSFYSAIPEYKEEVKDVETTIKTETSAEVSSDDHNSNALLISTGIILVLGIAVYFVRKVNK